MKGVIARLRLFAFVLIVVSLPHFAHAQVASFVFSSDPQTVEPNTVSQQLTVHSQDSGGTSSNVPSTACISLTSSSPQGQFSSSATNWSPVSVLTMSKNTANKNFFYKDPQTGTQTITAKIALKPDTVSSSCAAWPIDQWSVQWTATQNIVIGSSSSSGAETPDTTSNTSTTSNSSSTTQTQTANTVSSYVAPPTPDLYADAGKDRTVITGADTEFDARAYNKSKEIVDHVRFLWNFGDGTTADGPAVLHRFTYPGRYAVVVDIAQDKSAVSDTVIVTAEPAKLAFKALPDGGVEIDNLAGRDLDLSGWLVRAGAGLFPALFTLPPHSVILSGASMQIARTTLGFTATSQAQLQYPNGVAALQAGESTGAAAVTAPVTLPAPSAPVSVAHPVSAPARSFTDITASMPEQAADETSTEDASTSDATTASQVAAVGSLGGSYVWWAAAAALALLSVGALVLSKQIGKKEWDIIEEK
jgi:hypothetical protein